MALDLALALLTELVSPARCAACDAPWRALFCVGCAASVERPRARGAEALAVFDYGGAVANAIVRLKYHGRFDLADRFGPALRATLGTLAGGVDLLVPVPLHPTRLAERGYNQAALLAGAAARSTRLDHAPRALARIRPTPRQADLDRHARIANVADAFRCREPARVRGRRIVLVDDVRTTGATLASCAESLLASGAKKVVTLVLASRDGSARDTYLSE